MPPKRQNSKDRPRDEITDEWGIYDPAKAGMQALYARLGRPVLRDATTARRERRRAARPERSSEGVGLAIAEAQKRAGLHASSAGFESIPQSAARAMRQALRLKSADAVSAPAEPFVPPPQTPEPPVAPVAASPPPTAAAPPLKRRVVRKVGAAPAPTATETAPVAEPTTAKPRARGGARSRTQASQPTIADASAATAQPLPPAPSPRRPRGPVPLAAWAHAVVDTPPDARPVDRRGFWRGVFKIPADVALVEYAHGCRIQRLVIEAATEQVPDFI